VEERPETQEVGGKALTAVFLRGLHGKESPLSGNTAVTHLGVSPTTHLEERGSSIPRTLFPGTISPPWRFLESVLALSSGGSILQESMVGVYPLKTLDFLGNLILDSGGPSVFNRWGPRGGLEPHKNPIFSPHWPAFHGFLWLANVEKNGFLSLESLVTG